MVMTYDEYLKKNKKKKKEEPKVVLGYSNKNNVNNSPKSTTNTQTLIDKYVAEQKAKKDIAPVRTTVTTPKKPEERTWFQAGAFSDGYDFGDVAKTITGTTADVGLGITKGVFNLAEGIVDLGRYGVSGVANVLGAKEYAKDVKKTAQENTTQKWFSPIEKKIDKNSLIGEKGDTISEGLGYVASMIATGGVGGAIGGAVSGGAKAVQIGATLGTTGVTFTSAMGSGMSEAYEGGASDEEAVTYGAISGIAEAGTELIFGGLGKSINAVGLNTGLSSADDMLAKKVSEIFKKQVSKNIAETGIKMGAEGTEEVIAGILQAVGQKVTYKSEEELMQIIEDQELLESFISGAVVSGIAQAPSVVRDTKAGVDYVTGYTQQEQQAIDKVVNERITEQERQGITLTKKEKNAIIEQTTKEFNEFKEKVKEIAPVKDDVRSQDIAPVQQAGQQDTPVNERQQNYVSEAKETDSVYRKNLNEDASKYANNSKRTHEFVNTLSNISEATGENIRLTNNTSEEMAARRNQLIERYAKKKNISVEEATAKLKDTVIDAYNTGDGITINVNSPKALNRLVGHEITHSLEKTVEYNGKLQKIAIEYAKTKGEYDSRVEILESLYDGTNADINQELTADIVGDYLFTDQEFINNIQKKDRNLFQRIYDEIKHLIKLVTANTKEAKQLEQLKHSFEKAMAEHKSDKTNKVTVQETKSNSSVEVESNTQEKEEYSLSEQLEKNLEKRLLEAKGRVDFFEEYLEENDITNPTEKDMYDSWGTYEQIDADAEGFKEAEAEYYKTIREYLSSSTDNKGRKLSEEQIEFFEDSVVRDKDGKLLTMYHGTRADFYTFESARAGQNYEDNWSRAGRGFYFTPEEKVAKDYGESSVDNGPVKIKEVYLNITKPFDMATDYSETLKDMKAEYNIDDFYLKAGYRLIDWFRDAKIDSTEVLKKYGFDGIHDFDDYIAFESNQIKEVTNKKPTDSDDIRYSLSSVDSEGKELSKEQVEFFEDSKVRDKQGRLLEVYHGSVSENEINVFDTNIAPVRVRTGPNGTYFTSDKRRASSYRRGKGKVYSVYLNIKNPLNITEDIKKYQKEGMTFGEAKRKALEKLNDTHDGVIFEGDNVNNDEYIVFNSNQIKNVDNTNPTESDDIRYSLSNLSDDAMRDILLTTRNDISEQVLKKTRKQIAEERPDFFSDKTDNLGRKLSKGMKNFMKDSDARDINDSLTTVYHTTTDNIAQFNEFNPVGTIGYRFGDQVVNFYTNSKRMSGSYADQRYEMADTTKFNNLEEVNKWLEERNEGALTYRVDDSGGKYTLQSYGITDVVQDTSTGETKFERGWSVNKTFESLDDLLKNFRKYAHTDVAKFQYEGYVNITNPYVVDAEGRGYGEVERRIKQDQKDELDKITSDSDKVEMLMELASKSKERYEEYEFSGDEWTYYHYKNTADAIKGRELNQAVQYSAMFGFEYDTWRSLEGKEHLPSGDTTVTDLTSDLTETNYNMFKDMTLNDFVRIYAQEYEKNRLYGKEDSYFISEYKNITGELHALSQSVLYKIANSNFEQDYINRKLSEGVTTNDIVFRVLGMNKEGSNYDGVIIKNVVDYGGKADGDFSPADLFITFNSNQFKAWDNENPTDDNDIRYSLSVDDYGMSHRPSTDYGDASNFEENMPDVFEHPEWYMFGSDDWYKKSYKESWNALKKVRNNPEGEITIYRATIGDSINEGDWVTPSKTYAEQHNYSNLEGKGKVFELKVKAKDIRFGGDDLNEFGYFPNGTDNFSLSRTTDDIAPVKDADVFGRDIAVQEAIAPLQEQVKELTKVITDLQENIAPASLETAQAEGDRTLQQMTDEDAPVDEGLFTFLDNEVQVKKKQEIVNDIARDFSIKKTEARELYNKIDSIPEPTIEDIVKELEAYREIKFQEEDDYVKSIQDYIRGTRLDISEIKKQIPDYGNKYRMSNMGKGLILGNSGLKIDSFYQELSELYPNEFPATVTAEADQLELISDAMYREKEFTYTDIIDDDELQILAERIYADIGNSERYRHTQSGLYFLNKELKNMTPPGEVDNDMPVASNTEQTEDIAPVGKKSFEEIAEKFLERKRAKQTDTATPKTENNTPRIEKSKYRNFRDTTQRLFVNEMVETDNLAKETGNLNIKFKGDMLNSVAGEIEGEIQVAQTDNEGHAIGKSLSELFAPAKEKGLYDAFNDYLEHYSNIDRHAQSKGSKTPLNVSQTLVKAYEKSYPEFKQWGKDVWKYGANVRDNLIDAGIISEEHAEALGTMYPHYVPYMENREMSNYNPDLGEIKPKGVIKRAVGGAENLLPIEDALTKYTFGYKKAVRQNQFYQEIVKTLGPGVDVGADVRNDAIDFEDTLYKDETGNYLTAYVDGERVSTRITDDLYTGLKNDLSKQIKGLEEKYALITEPVQKLSEIRRNLLTSWNPMFIIKNPIMDIQDALFNSKYTKDFMKNYPGAFIELGQAKSETARQFLTLYGSGNVMGEHSADGTVKKSNFLKGIQRANNVMELAPRYAEFKASLENGASIQEAMYNAREVTTNFSRGGTITKALNKNGFTFLNVSVQGFDKFIRNFSGENGAKGFTGALLKATLLGVAPALFNDLLFGGDDEDEEYEALPDYIKDNYYLIKTGEGEFIRIPKGRMLSVFGSAGRRTLEFMQGEEDAFEGFLKNANSQVGISNPLDSNILTPLIQAYGSENGEAWYGGDLVPSRLQKKAPEEQYDATTDKMSIWLGDKLGISPYKLNYVLDQYSGGIGDIFLPFITEEATSDAEGLGMVLAPIKDQFTVNSTSDNKYAGEIYDLSDKMDKMPEATKETDEYKVQDAYLYSVTSEMGKLYEERRKVQADKNLSKSEKYKKVQAIQKQINDLAKEGMENYQNVSKTDNYAIVGGREFNKYTTDDGTERWGSVFEDVLEDLNSLGMDLDEKSEYFKATSTISSVQDSYKGSDDFTGKKQEVIGVIKGTNLTGEQKAYLYDKYYGNSDVVEAMVNLNVDIDSFLDYEAQDFTADKYANGKTVPNSKKRKVFEYINSMPIEFEQRLVLAKLQYPSYNEYNPTIIEYLNNSEMTYEQVETLLTKMDFKVDENGNIRW